MSSPANVFHRHTVHAPFSLPSCPEVWYSGWAFYQELLTYHLYTSVVFKIPQTLHTCLSCRCVLGKFPLSSSVPVLSDHFLSPDFQSQADDLQIWHALRAPHSNLPVVAPPGKTELSVFPSTCSSSRFPTKEPIRSRTQTLLSLLHLIQSVAKTHRPLLLDLSLVWAGTATSVLKIL
jgi:hypothetical protein